MNPFILKLIISFFVAGVWISIATLLAERLGSKIGGLIANLPSTILVSLLFIGLTQTAAFASEAARAVPIGMTISSVFLFTYILMLKKSSWLAPLTGLAAWFLLASIAGFLNYSGMFTGAIIYIAMAVLMFLFLEFKMHLPSKQRSKKPYTTIQLLLRALFAGAVVVTAVLLSSIGGPVWGGLFSTFPAVMLSSMLILTKSQGPEFSQATGKVMMLSSINILVYGLAVHYLYPLLGLALGTLASYAAAVIWVVLLHPMIKRTV